jgi:hypothetical protein
MSSGKFFGRDFLKKRYEIVVLLEGVIEQTGNSIQVHCIKFLRGNKKGEQPEIFQMEIFLSLSTPSCCPPNGDFLYIWI